MDTDTLKMFSIASEMFDKQAALNDAIIQRIEKLESHQLKILEILSGKVSE